MESRRERKGETATSTSRSNSEYRTRPERGILKSGKPKLCPRLCGQNLVTKVVDSGENKEVAKNLKET